MATWGLRRGLRWEVSSDRCRALRSNYDDMIEIVEEYWKVDDWTGWNSFYAGS